jgi:hypothetical protein
MLVLLRSEVSKFPQSFRRVVAVFFYLLHHASTRLSFHLSTALFARFLHIRKYISLIEAICINYKLLDNSAITVLYSIFVASIDSFSKFSSLQRQTTHLDNNHSHGQFLERDFASVIIKPF